MEHPAQRAASGWHDQTPEERRRYFDGALCAFVDPEEMA
jgi:hypothetical protein